MELYMVAEKLPKKTKGISQMCSVHAVHVGDGGDVVVSEATAAGQISGKDLISTWR